MRQSKNCKKAFYQTTRHLLNINGSISEFFLCYGFFLSVITAHLYSSPVCC